MRGVAALLPLVKPRTDAALLHSVIECLWSAVVPEASNVRRLVERNGVLYLLDVLEGAPFAPRAHLLSCLADLIAESADGLAQCKEWHGKKRQSATQLCLSLWSEEAARRGLAAGSGLLQSAQRPISTHSAEAYQNLNASLVIPDEEGASAAAEISDPSADAVAKALHLTSRRARDQRPPRRRRLGPFSGARVGRRPRQAVRRAVGSLLRGPRRAAHTERGTAACGVPGVCAICNGRGLA